MGGTRLKFVLLCTTALCFANSAKGMGPPESAGAWAQVALEAPPEARFSRTAPTWEGLAQAHPANLTWPEGTNARFFLWVSEPDKIGTRTLTFDRAYLVKQAGRTFWAFLGLPDDGEPWSSPQRQFLNEKHVRAEARLPGSHRPDGREAWAELLSESPDGRTLVRIFYPSVMGARPDHIDSRSWLIYFPGRDYGRKPELATIDLPDNSGYRNGTTICTRAVGFDVVWHEAADQTPFHLIAHESVRYDGAWEDESRYTINVDSVWTGALPLGRVRQDSAPYAVADGRTSLNSLAETMAHFHSGWTEANWVTAQQRALAITMWKDELARLNPSLRPGSILEEGTRIAPPDTAATDKRIREAVRGATNTGGGDGLR